MQPLRDHQHVALDADGDVMAGLTFREYLANPKYAEHRSNL